MKMVSRNIPEEHDDEEGSEGHGTCESMGASNIAEEKDDFVQAAAVGYLVSSQSCEPHLGNELVYKDDYTDGADEAAQEWPAQDIVQETKSKEACDQDKGTSHARHDASDLGITSAVVVAGSTLLDVLTHDLAYEEGARCLWTNDHLRTGAEYGVNQRIQREAVETVDGRQVGKVGSIGESHGNVEGGHGDGGDEVALEVAPLVLLGPVEDGNVVLEVHHALVLDAMALSEPARRAHLLPTPLVHDAVCKGVAQESVCLVGRIALCCLAYARKGAAEALLRVDATREAAIVAMCRRPSLGPVEGAPVLLVQQARAHRGLEVDLDDAAGGSDFLMG